jgi:hypothetical protein
MKTSWPGGCAAGQTVAQLSRRVAVAAWEAHWIDDGLEEKLVCYCAECAEGELGAED